jgi:hypothetical protein
MGKLGLLNRSVEASDYSFFRAFAIELYGDENKYHLIQSGILKLVADNQRMLIPDKGETMVDVDVLRDVFLKTKKDIFKAVAELYGRNIEIYKVGRGKPVL